MSSSDESDSASSQDPGPSVGEPTSTQAIVGVLPTGPAGRQQWALEAMMAAQVSYWRWSAPDHSFLFGSVAAQQPSDEDDYLRIDWWALLKSTPSPERRRLIALWKRLNGGHQDRVDTLIQPDADMPEVKWRVRGAITARDANALPVAATGTWEIIDDLQDQRSVDSVKAHAFVASRDPMLVVDERWYILETNDAFVQLGGLSPSKILGQPLQYYIEAEVLHCDPAAAAGNDRLQHHEGVFHVEGAPAIPIELTLSQFTPDETGQTHYIAVLRDISARKRSERELEQLASIDTLTQLPNRATLQQTLNRRLARLSPDHGLAVLFIDLDGFKNINDSLGHQAGDILLKIMVKRLRATLRSKDLVARWGGDEFVVIIDLGSDTHLGDRIALRLLEALSHPMVIGGHQISVTASIGIVHAPSHGRDGETLLKHADVAMYAAKDRGKNAIVVYHEQLKHHNLEQMSMLSRLREAIAGASLDFVVQPKFDSQSRVIGAELLARWATSEHGHVPPSTFVPLAEQHGMASALGNLAIDRAAGYAARLAASGNPLPVAVNISALHVMDASLADTLCDACRRHGITTDQIELEVTESVFLENTRAPETRIEHLRRQGFRVAMDDFGAGYSSLGYLKRLPFDTIKIDRSFMHDLEADPRSRHLLAGIVGLCDLLGMETVAEGVETESQWQLLQTLGVKQYQGYLLGRPMAMEQLIEQLKDKR
ncbi:putative bifunctional diguanylate cyclase/phosphodiesterase [Salinicola halimionae]|uniref:putative bifunctional diguanylate cyclase/phosphodiesterase n=1 Tax=Salinicola halimionae TaxID=1949081 RepID=UPI000DA25ACD|nr:GGDEF and EAL domain-containing protein [Salinicola halimionae]